MLRWTSRGSKLQPHSLKGANSNLKNMIFLYFLSVSTSQTSAGDFLSDLSCRPSGPDETCWE